MGPPQQRPQLDLQQMFSAARQQHQAGRFEDAERIYRQILSVAPNLPEVHYNLACLFQDRRKLKDAITHYECAIALRPELVGAHINLGNTLRDMGKLDDAVQSYKRALALDPASAEAHYNFATALKDKNKFDEAIEHYRRALDLKPDYVEAHNNIGVLLREQGQLHAAIQHFRKATTLKPDHIESYVNEAMSLLLLGDLAAGWKKYEWRWRMKGVKPLDTRKPLWDGGDLYGKTVLLRGEQGLGDCLQFIRYAPLVKERGGHVIVSCPTALVRLFKAIPAIDHVIPAGEALPDYDCHVPLMSLPLLFGTTLENVPNAVPYLFPVADEVSAWAEQLKPVEGFKVGLVWAGNSRPDHPDAHAVDRRRSMQLSQFAPLSGIPGVQLFSLQKGEPARQLASPPPGLSVIDPMGGVQDFADTAALVANLDLVIGVDTSVVHLAGALGKPVWVLSRFDGCWRWLLDREDSPWYPEMRLFRQPRLGDWESVIAEVEVALRQTLAQIG